MILLVEVYASMNAKMSEIRKSGGRAKHPERACKMSGENVLSKAMLSRVYVPIVTNHLIRIDD